METHQVIIGVIGLLIGIGTLVAGIFIPLIMAARKRDETLVLMIQQAKEDARLLAETKTRYVEERIDRIQQNYVRRDDFDAHMNRLDKQMDEIKDDIRRQVEQFSGDFREVKQMIRLAARLAMTPSVQDGD